MSFDLYWTHHYCLGCDRQTDGQAYCSESCRLADNEKSLAPRSGASSPGLNGASPSAPWTTKQQQRQRHDQQQQQQQQQSKFYLSPAYDFSNAQPYGSTPLPQLFLSQRSNSTVSRTTRILSPSSSHTSLCSIQSNSNPQPPVESTQLSDKTRQELRDYASSFEQVRLQRRRSY